MALTHLEYGREMTNDWGKIAVRLGKATKEEVIKTKYEEAEKGVHVAGLWLISKQEACER